MDTQESNTTIGRWDNYFLHRAQLCSTMSKDPSTKVGAVITRGKRAISDGFNGFPKNVDDSDYLYQDRKTKLARSLHAELNAILGATQDLSGCSIYVYPMPPCSKCAAAIVQKGIKKVITFYPTESQASRWGDSFQHARELFEQAGIDVVYYEKWEVFPEESTQAVQELKVDCPYKTAGCAEGITCLKDSEESIKGCGYVPYFEFLDKFSGGKNVTRS